MLTVDFCIAFIQMIPRPIRRKVDLQMVEVVERGIPIPASSILGASDIHSMFDSRVKFNKDKFESVHSPVIIYSMVYAYVMDNQNEFINRLKKS